MRVWLVTEQEWEHTNIHGVFSNNLLAQLFVQSQQYPDHYEITEYQVDGALAALDSTLRDQMAQAQARLNALEELKPKPQRGSR